MRKKIIIALALSLIYASISFAAEYTDGDVIVVLKNNEQPGTVMSSAMVAASFAETNGASLKETYQELSDLGNGIYSMIHSDTMDAEEFAEVLKNNPDVIAASPNYKVYTAATLPNESEAMMTEENCWGMFAVNAPEVWDKNTGDSSVYVAIIDSGIDYTNPDIANNYSANYSYADAIDTYGHGTHVAGIIGAEGNNGIGLAGINWHVKLISVKSLANDGGGSISDVIKGVNYVTRLINTYNLNIKVVNMSFETYYVLEPTYENLVKDPLWRAFKDLDSLNKTVMVVAAGNKSVTIGEPDKSGAYVYPASFKGLNNMITVGALSNDLQLASFCNKGADVLAPGVNILSTYIQSSPKVSTDDGVSLSYMTGSSMATPFVSGAAALLAAMNPYLTAYQIKTAIVSGSNKLASASGNIFSLSDVVDFYEENQNDVSVMPATAPSTQYDNYKNETEIENPNYYYKNNYEGNYSTGGGGGGCNGLMSGIFASLIFIPLVKKFNS